MGADFVVSILMLALAGVFWAQRNYMTPFGGIWPDAILVALAALSALLLVRTAVAAAVSARTRQSGETGGASRAGAPEAADPSHPAPDPLAWVLGMSVALTVWLAVFWKLGFVVGGTLGFAALAAFLAPKGRADWKLWARALAAGAAWALVLYLAFGHMLSVPLPFGWWGGRF